jgi:hypothetical protein
MKKVVIATGGCDCVHSGFPGLCRLGGRGCVGLSWLACRSEGGSAAAGPRSLIYRTNQGTR